MSKRKPDGFEMWLVGCKKNLNSGVKTRDKIFKKMRTKASADALNRAVAMQVAIGQVLKEYRSFKGNK